MKNISKKCKSLNAAVAYQNRLYNQYNYVRLVKVPRWEESGIYVWEVK